MVEDNQTDNHRHHFASDIDGYQNHQIEGSQSQENEDLTDGATDGVPNNVFPHNFRISFNESQGVTKLVCKKSQIAKDQEERHEVQAYHQVDAGHFREAAEHLVLSQVC